MLIKNILLILGTLLVFTGCSRTGKNNAQGPFNEYKTDPGIFSTPVPGDVLITPVEGPGVPVAGTVSHHGLTAGVITAYFKELRRMRDIKTFVILSPRHFDYSEPVIGISDYAWKSGPDLVQNQRTYTEFLKKELGLTYDNASLSKDHGIYLFMPYIKHYFPGAQVVTIVMDEFNKRISSCYALGDLLAKIVSKDPGVFLLLSIDFSHRENREITNRRDRLSREVLLSLDKRQVNRAYSDNNVGMITLFHTLEKLGGHKTHIFCHTDADFFGNPDPNDITSYFFTYQFAR